jgi:hypothetical protein
MGGFEGFDGLDAGGEGLLKGKRGDVDLESLHILLIDTRLIDRILGTRKYLSLDKRCLHEMDNVAGFNLIAPNSETHHV